MSGPELPNLTRSWTSGSSFNYLIGDGKHCRRHLDAERSCRLQIDEKLELGRLQHRQLGRPRALEYAAGIDADLMKCLRVVASVAHQPAGHDILTLRISRRNF